MTVREVLQKEIWSKETSRKILLVCGLLVTGILVWNQIQSKWLTPSERKAGRAALVEVDALQKSAEMSDEEYGAAYKRAEAKVDAADKAAWTGKDRSIAVLLSIDLMSIDWQRMDRKMILQMNASKHGSLEQAARAFDSAEISKMAEEVLIAPLHQDLK